MNIELVKLYVVTRKEREGFRWRSGIGWRENRKYMGMSIYGSK